MKDFLVKLPKEKNKIPKPSWSKQKRLQFISHSWFKQANIIIGKRMINKKHKILFFDEIDCQEISMGYALYLHYKHDVKWPEILADMGIFESRSAAYKNGFGNEKSIIPMGFNEIKSHKLKNPYNISVLKLQSF